MAKKKLDESPTVEEPKKEESASVKIRAVMEEFPELKPAAIVDYLAERGTTVKVGLVNAVRSQMRKKEGGTPSAPKATEYRLDLGSALEVKRLCGEIGVDKVQALAEVVGKIGTANVVSLSKLFE